MAQNQQWVFTKFANGPIDKTTFDLQNIDQPAEPTEGQVQLKLVFVSVDPYMRGRMNEQKNYFDTFQIGKPFNGGVVAEVVKSNDPKFQVGQSVQGFLPWIVYQNAPTQGLVALPPNVRGSYFLGTLGMPGLSAYFPLYEIGQVKGEHTVFISGAAGAVGNVAGQICKALGCKVIGSAGTDEKLKYLKEIGFDHVMNYKTDNQSEKLKEFAPDGLDIYFDNVGAQTLDIALEHMKLKGTVICCGQIANYETLPADRYGNKNLFYVITKRLKMQGFIVSDWMSKFGEGTQELLKLYQAGKLQPRETVVKGFDQVPTAFMGLFTGDNTGKMVIEL